MSELLDIGVDIDEVLYDFVGAARTWLRREGYDGPMPDPTDWDIASQWGLARQEFNDACDRGVDAGFIFTVGAPLDGTALALYRLTQYGYVHLVTNRAFGMNGAARHNTLAWLKMWGLPYDSLTFIDNKAHGPRCDIYIDDRPRNYDQLEAAGMHPYFLTHPWNQDHPGRRVADLNEFVDVVQKLKYEGRHD